MCKPQLDKRNPTCFLSCFTLEDTSFSKGGINTEKLLVLSYIKYFSSEKAELGPKPPFFSLCSDWTLFSSHTAYKAIYWWLKKPPVAPTYPLHSLNIFFSHAPVTLNWWFSHLHFQTLSASFSITIMTIILLNLSRLCAIFSLLFFLLFTLISYPKSFSGIQYFISTHISASTAIQRLSASINRVLFWPWVILLPILSASLAIFVQQHCCPTTCFRLCLSSPSLLPFQNLNL